MKKLIVGKRKELEEIEILLQGNGIRTDLRLISAAYYLGPLSLSKKMLPIDYCLSILYEQQFADAEALMTNPNHKVKVRISENEHNKAKEKSRDALSMYMVGSLIIVLVLSLLVYKFVV